MENTELNSIIERYKELKRNNYEIENQLRTLIKTKEKFPAIAKDEKWLKKYRKCLSEISEEMDCYKKIKGNVSESEMQEIAYTSKAEIFQQIYYDNNLDRFDMREENVSAQEYNIKTVGYICNNLDPQIENESSFEKSQFAQMILKEKNFFKKLDLAVYLAKKENNFFDTSVIYKAMIAKLFVNKMKIADIDENEVVTAAIMYTCKKVDSAQEIDRIKNEKNKDFDYLKTLGFSDRFCKICIEHTRYNQPTENYERESEGDILELVENYVGLTMHREDRMAFPIDEALDLIENKNLQGKYNRYLGQFKKFVKIMEDIRICSTSNDIPDTTLHKIYNIVNSQPRKNVTNVANGLAGVMKSLSEKHIIQESETTRASVDSRVSERMSRIEDILLKSFIAISLNQHYVSKSSELQNTRSQIKEITSSKKTDEIVNDIIGG